DTATSGRHSFTVHAADQAGNTATKTVQYVVGGVVSTVKVTCPASVTFDGSAQTPCSARVTGADGLDEGVAVSYENNVHAGTATATASYAGSAEYLPSSDSATFTIAKAPTTLTLTCPEHVTFDGTAQTPCSARVTGPGGLDAGVPVSYENNLH